MSDNPTAHLAYPHIVGSVPDCPGCRADGGELLGYANVAALTGLSAATLRGYRAAGRMPEPDALPAPDRPRWKPATIAGWLAERPGRGAPGRSRRTRRP